MMLKARAPARQDTPSGGGIAVLCFGFLGNPIGIQRLARYFARIDARIYLHIDAKADIAPYAEACAALPNVTLVQDRVAIWWGGFSLTSAVISVLRQATGDEDYHRYCLITEDSAPLADAESFRAQMMQPCEWIKLGAMDLAGYCRRYRNFYYLDCAATNPRSHPDRRRVEPPVLHALMRLEALRSTGKYPLARLFHGPGWWALSRRAIAEILLQYDTNSHMRESFEFSLIPDEQYFHTVVGNAAEAFECRPFIYADFSRQPSPFTFSTLAELHAARAMPFLFIRKVSLPSPDIARYFEMLEHEA